MTHIKRQKLIPSTQVRGYNTHFLSTAPELMKLIFAVLYVLCCYKTEGFLHLYF